MNWIPGWQTVAGAAWWSSFWFWVSICSLMLLGVAEVISHRYSGRKDELTEQQQAAIQHRHEDAMAHLQVEAANLNDEAAKARLETEKLKATVVWRSLSSDIAAALEKALAPKPGAVNLRWMDGDPEALYFAIQLSQILGKAHWNVAPGAVKPPNTIVFGIALPDSTSADAKALRHAFTTAGIAFSTNPIPQGLGFSIATIQDAPTLMIGSRPPSQLP